MEDSKFISKVTVNELKRYFNNIYTAHNGQEGLELLSRHKNEIDIVITDLIMPIMDGIEMMESIRKSGCSIPVVITTGFNEAIAQEKLIDLAVEGFLSKPIDLPKLLNKVNTIVESLFIKRELAIKKEMIDNDIIYSETDNAGFITYVSKPFEKISGYTKDELIGKKHSILRDPDTPDALYGEMWATLISHKQWQGEVRNRKKDGSYYSVNNIISPIYFREKLIGYSAVSIDITELKEKSQELQIKSKQAALGDMISMIAHQWRQPITSIGLISNSLRLDAIMNELDAGVLIESLKTIDQQVAYLSDTIDLFRKFLESNKNKEELVMEEVIAEAVLAADKQCKTENLIINIDNKCKHYKLNTLKSELTQVLINILINAKEAFMQTSVTEPNIDISCEKDLKFIYIKISDNAGGIDEHVFSKIFTPYFSTKPNKNGAGLGLYMTKTIVEGGLDGELSFKNIDNGVEFTIKLPK